MENAAEEQAVELHVPITGDWGTPDEIQALMELEEAMTESLPESLGLLDGNDIGMGEYTYFFFAPSADKLVPWIREQVAEANLPEKSYFQVYRDPENEDEEDEGERIPLIG